MAGWKDKAEAVDDFDTEQPESKIQSRQTTLSFADELNS